MECFVDFMYSHQYLRITEVCCFKFGQKMKILTEKEKERLKLFSNNGKGTPKTTVLKVTASKTTTICEGFFFFTAV